MQTQRLSLRQFTAEDAHYLHQIDNDPDVMRYINGGIPISLENIQIKFLPLFLKYDKEQPCLGFWLVSENESSDFVGWCCLRADEHNPNVASVGYRFLKSAWGKGYATEATRLLINRGFTELGLQRIIADTYEENMASRRVMEKLGLRFVRTFRFNPNAQETSQQDETQTWDGDDVEYALDRSDWEQF
jgi:RimJ/RimL family protein N-acetyltransferase